MDRRDPFARHRFAVEIDGIIQARFSSVSGLSAETDIVEVQEGGRNAEMLRLPGQGHLAAIVLKRGYRCAPDLEEWQQNIRRGIPDRRNVSIVVLNDDGSEARRYDLRRVWPTRWSMDGLDSGGGLAIETLELAHEGVRFTSGATPARRDPVRPAETEDTAGPTDPISRILAAVRDFFGGGDAPKAPSSGSSVLDVPHRVQSGPTCGIAALGMVLDYWKAKDSSNAAPSNDDLLKQAQDAGLTETGGTSAEDRAALAESNGYDADVQRGGSMDDLKAAVDRGEPPIVGIFVDDAGDPVGEDNDRRHAVVVKGFKSEGGKEYVVAEHGWSNAQEKVWPAEDFEKSWQAAGGAMTVVRPKGK